MGIQVIIVQISKVVLSTVACHIISTSIKQNWKCNKTRPYNVTTEYALKIRMPNDKYTQTISVCIGHMYSDTPASILSSSPIHFVTEMSGMLCGTNRTLERGLDLSK